MFPLKRVKLIHVTKVKPNQLQTNYKIYKKCRKSESAEPFKLGSYNWSFAVGTINRLLNLP